MSFQVEASVERFRAYLEVDFEEAGQGLVSERFLGETGMLADEGVGASYSGG